jgi:hypothetical protein
MTGTVKSPSVTLFLLPKSVYILLKINVNAVAGYFIFL